MFRRAPREYLFKEHLTQRVNKLIETDRAQNAERIFARVQLVGERA